MPKKIETIKYKLLPNYPDAEKFPPLAKAYKGDAGFDLYSAETRTVYGNTSVKIKTGISVAIPEGYFGKVFDRSSIATQTPFLVKAGVIDSGYRGEIIVVLQNLKVDPWQITTGQKIAQMVVLPVPEFKIEPVDELPEEDRGDKGFGSSN